MDKPKETVPENTPYAMVVNSPKLEARQDHHKPGVWQLNLSDFVKAIDPLQYFMTSGEAVTKTRVLERDLFRAACDARKLGNILEKLRDKSVFLETQWHDRRLVIIKKDPRPKKPRP